MKRRTFVSHKQKSVQKSLLSSSEWARVPSGLTCFGIFALSWGLRWNWSRHVFKRNASFLYSTWLNEVLLAMILRAVSTNLYTDTLCRHLLCCNTKILDHLLIFCFSVCHFWLLFISIELHYLKSNIKWDLKFIPFTSGTESDCINWYCTCCDLSFGKLEKSFFGEFLFCYNFYHWVLPVIC